MIQSANGQTVKSVVPDSGSQGLTFPITINGSSTEWTLSPYFEVYFDSIGVGTTGVTIINDSTLTGTVLIDGKASLAWHKVVVADQFNNLFTKDTALFVRLSIPPAPLLISPLNNAQNQLQNPSLLWDSNGYATYFRVQVALDSLFTNKKVDTTVANPPYSVRPNLLALNTKYFWRINATNSKGTSPWSPVWNFRVRSTGVGNISEEIPSIYKLFNNYPNPFNPETNIKFQVPEFTDVKIEVYDVNGKLVERLINSRINAGTYSIKWKGNNNPSGIYFCKLTAGKYSETKKIVLLK